VYPCIGAKKSPFCKTNTQKMVVKVNNLRTEEKPSFVYLRIRVSGQRNRSLIPKDVNSTIARQEVAVID
jgi:hypothetical protein